MLRVPKLKSRFVGELFLDVKGDAPSKDNRGLKVSFKCFAVSDLRLLGLHGEESCLPKCPPCNAFVCHGLLKDLNHDPLNLIQRNLIAGAVIELGGFRAFVIGDPLVVLDGDAVFQVVGDSWK
jgi:hypothetical protein